MKASDYVVSFLEYKHVASVYEMAGGMITHLLDSLSRSKKIRVISMHHEQAAAFAAEAAGRLTGIPGVAMATSGPGATNLLTGIGSCYFDSSPAVFITGQVNRHEIKGNRPIRQLGFQETDIVSLARPITKAAWQVPNAEALPAHLERAFSLAVAARPGPVLLDIPMDVQRGNVLVPRNSRRTEDRAEPKRPFPLALIKNLFADLRRAKRPLILIGGGVRAARAEELARRFILRAGVPVVHSLMAVDILPHNHPLRVGIIGSYGNRWANLAIGESDFILVLGSRLDIRQTGSDVEYFKGARVIYHVDCEPGEINNRVPGCHAIVADLADFFK